MNLVFRKSGGLVVVASSLLTGCLAFVPVQSIDKTGIETILAASRMPVVSSQSSLNMENLGEVVGHSCMNTTIDPAASRVGAVDQAKIVAVQRGATAISDPMCEEGGVSLFKNCWHSWECKANAFR